MYSFYLRAGFSCFTSRTLGPSSCGVFIGAWTVRMPSCDKAEVIESGSTSEIFLFIYAYDMKNSFNFKVTIW